MAISSTHREKKIPIEMVQFFVVDDHGFVRHIVAEVLKRHQIRRHAFAENGREAMSFLRLPSLQLAEISGIDRMARAADLAGDRPRGSDFAASHAHCVITDFKMGDINGLHILKAIRCGETRVPRDTPVILLTGFSDDFVVSVALQLDVNAFVLKPVSHNTLWEKIQRVLKSVTPTQDVNTYRKVVIPNDTGEIAPPKKARANEHEDDDTRWLPLTAVIPGAILARDLHGTSGSLLLRKGTAFSPAVLQKLTDLDKMHALSGHIPIHAPVTAGGA